VLGAGGAGRAAAYALREAGAEVAVWNRTAERASELAADLGVSTAEKSDPAGFDLLVNTTSVGLDGRGGLDDLGIAGAAPPETVVDLVYGEAETPVCAWARGGGARVVDGLEVLVRQGALSFRIWTGVEPPLEVMRAAARR
jgi:shikimate dehydrogenase